ncbi:MAG: hypothetical protein AAGB30_10670 [Pedobacter sp.]
MKTRTIFAILLTAVSSGALAQQAPKTAIYYTDEERNELAAARRALLTNQTPLPIKQFKEVVFADFTKLLQTDLGVGKPLSYASVNVAKPMATVSYSFRPKPNEDNPYAWRNKFFFNLGASGGYEDDIISLVASQKPAKSYAANAQTSFILFSKYFYGAKSGNDINELKNKRLEEYHIFKWEAAKVISLSTELTAIEKRLKAALDTLYSLKNKKDTLSIPTAEDKVIALRQQRKDKNAELNKLDGSIELRKRILDTVLNAAKFTSKHLVWITFGQKAGGNQFRYYLPAAPETSPKNKYASHTYKTSFSGNYYYKNSNRKFRSLLTLGFEAGRYNNFAELSGSELKATAKTDIPGAPTTNSYTKTDVYTVYDLDDYKPYHAVKAYVEGYLLFGVNGNFGFRARHLFDMPYSEDPLDASRRRAQQDLQIGAVFNTSAQAKTAKEEPSPISFEIYYGFTDLYGRQKDATGKFFKRNEIGVRTAIPFSF